MKPTPTDTNGHFYRLTHIYLWNRIKHFIVHRSGILSLNQRSIETKHQLILWHLNVGGKNVSSWLRLYPVKTHKHMNWHYYCHKCKWPLYKTKYYPTLHITLYVSVKYLNAVRLCVKILVMKMCSLITQRHKMSSSFISYKNVLQGYKTFIEKIKIKSGKSATCDVFSVQSPHNTKCFTLDRTDVKTRLNSLTFNKMQKYLGIRNTLYDWYGY